jgi:hypothetical protein
VVEPLNEKWIGVFDIIHVHVPLFVSVLGKNQWDGVVEKLREGLSELSCCRSLNG